MPRLAENDIVEYDGRRGVIQAIVADIYYVFFMGLGLVPFGRNLRPVRESAWAKAVTESLEPKNSQKTSASSTKYKPCAARWLH
jgi:hypothetical protein